MKKILQVKVLLLSLFLVACKTELYSAMDEYEVNNMLAVLLDNNISADKIFFKEGLYNLRVESSQVAQAIEILKSQGFPKEKFTDLGMLFAKEGLISSPTEERVRFLYGTSQELSRTLSLIDGVISSRVHVVIPEPNPGTQIAEPATASVFIKYNRAFDLDNQINQIKVLVANSVEGLSFERVTVVLFPAQDPRYPISAKADNYKPTYAKTSATAQAAAKPSVFSAKNFVSVFVTIALMGGIGLFLYMYYTKQKNRRVLDEYDLPLGDK